MTSRIFSVFALSTFALSIIFSRFPSRAHASKLTPAAVMKNADELPPPTKGLCLPTGATAPDFNLKTIDGSSIRLSDVTKSNSAILVFYRGGWCPFCNLQLQEYNSELEKFEKLNLKLIAISVDKPDKELLKKNKAKLGFPIASDSDLNAIKPYNLLHTVDKITQIKYRAMGIDLETSSGRKDGIIAVPAVVVVDKNQKIKWCYANEDYKIRPSFETILQNSQDKK